LERLIVAMLPSIVFLQRQDLQDIMQHERVLKLFHQTLLPDTYQPLLPSMKASFFILHSQEILVEQSPSLALCYLLSGLSLSQVHIYSALHRVQLCLQ
jgi:hypothetical protein